MLTTSKLWNTVKGYKAGCLYPFFYFYSNIYLKYLTKDIKNAKTNHRNNRH